MESLNKAWLEYHDKNEFGKIPSGELAIARLAFKAGYEAGQNNVQQTLCLCTVITSGNLAVNPECLIHGNMRQTLRPRAR